MKTIAAFGEEHWESMKYIISKESGFNPNAVNKSSGAEGLCQALPYSKTNCKHGDLICQTEWCINYIQNRFLTPNRAREFWDYNGWF